MEKSEYRNPKSEVRNPNLFRISKFGFRIYSETDMKRFIATTLLAGLTVGALIGCNTLPLFNRDRGPTDTTEKVKLEDLRANIAAMAVMAYVLADMPDALRQSATSTR